MAPFGADTGVGTGMLSIDNEYFPFVEVIPPERERERSLLTTYWSESTGSSR
jgi:hypothetical protein